MADEKCEERPAGPPQDQDDEPKARRRAHWADANGAETRQPLQTSRSYDLGIDKSEAEQHSGDVRNWQMQQQFIEERIKTLALFPVAAVSVGLILIYFADILRSLAVAVLLWLIFAPLIDIMALPFYYPIQLVLWLSGAPLLDEDVPRESSKLQRWLKCIARIRFPRVFCVILVLVLIGGCFWLLIAKVFTSISTLLQDSDHLLTLLSEKVDELRELLAQSYLADAVDWDAVVDQMVSHAREMTTQESVEAGIWWVIRLVRISLGTLFIVLLIFTFLSLAGGNTRAGGANERIMIKRPKSKEFSVVEKYLYAQTFLSLLTAVVNGTIYGYLRVPASFLFALTTFWLNFIPVVGSVIAVIIPMPLALIALDMHDCFLAFVLPSITQILIGNTLYPVLMGATMLLHPVVILVGMSMFGTIWSIPGMILSVPIMGVMKSYLTAMSNPYAQVVSHIFQGDLVSAKNSWEWARHQMMFAKSMSPRAHDRSRVQRQTTAFGAFPMSRPQSASARYSPLAGENSE